MAGPSVPERISQCYYSHGLFCSSHPVFTISCAIICFLACCFPLINIPLPGSIPQKVYLPYKYNSIQSSFKDVLNLFVQTSGNFSKEQLKQNSDNITELPNYKVNADFNLSSVMNETVNLPYLWAKEVPLLYVQQIVLKTGVWPWHDELKLSDAFRAPLQEVFRLLEIIRNHQHPESGTSLGHICFHVESVKRNVAAHKESPVLPEYSCLLLSPANLWQQNLDRFLLDTNILSTVFNHQNLLKGKVSLADMVFGMQLKDTGVKRYPFRARPRALQYSVTIFFQHLNDKYINSLKEKLFSFYPVHHKWDKSHSPNQIMLIYYPGEFNYQEFVPLCLTFIGLFIYIYFSVRKLEFVQSKLGLAIAAVSSVAASFVMTIGICFFFGLTLSFQGKEIFPYLVILVGIENVFVLTKSVMSIDFKLDVKIRLAQGLCKEGWSITKNLLIEITILTISLFTFVPVIQQFSIFMIVSLLSDFFLQMLFFTTVLGIDIRRKETLREKISEFQINQQHTSSNQGKLFIHNLYSHSDRNAYPSNKIIRSKSHPRLNGLNYQPHTDVVANLHQDPVLVQPEQIKKVPKRIRLVKIWARTRFFQRAFMIWMVVWISMIIYNSGIIESIFDLTDVNSKDVKSSYKINETNVMDIRSSTTETSSKLDRFVSLIDENNKLNHSLTTYSDHVSKNHKVTSNQKKIDKSDLENIEFNAEILNKTLHFISLKHLTLPQPWLRLSEFHWSSILSQYNVSFRGRYVTILPPILLKHRVTPEKAVAIRNPAEKDNMTPPSRWRALIAALDPLDLTDFEIDDGISIPLLQKQHWGIPQSPNEEPYYPSTPMEILLLAILCLISVIVIAYTMVVLYGCICTKNYAEWRTSWKTLEKETHSSRPALQFVMEAVPIVVKGHTQEIECLATNGDSIVSSCLQGQLKMWNSSNGELIANIDRHVFFGLQNNICRRLRCQETIESEPKFSNELDLSSEKPAYSVDDDSVIRQRIYSKPSFILHESNDHTPNSVETSKFNIQETPEFHHLPKNIVFSKSTNSTKNVEENTKVNSNLCQIGHVRPTTLDESLTLQNTCNNQNIHTSNKIPPIINDPTYPPPIWCMDFSDNLIVLGCSDGRLEFWEASTAKFKCIYDDGYGAGVSNVKLLEGLSGCGMHVVVARLTGHLDLLLLESSSPTLKSSKKTHIRTGSAGSILLREESTHHRFSHEHDPSSIIVTKSSHTPEDPVTFNFDFKSKSIEDPAEKIYCRRLATTRAHQQCITVLECDWGRILSGSQDHTLKVFSSYDLSAIYTLHGHCGPITCAFIDRFCPMVSASGSEDGLLCVWDLMSGACLYSMQAHDGPITGLVYSESYVISMGADERLCIWDRFRGHLLNSMNIGPSAGGCGMLTITHSLVITGGKSGLIVWDASTGEAVRKVVLGPSDGYVFVRQILPLKDAIVCDYANELRIIRFPIVSRIDREYERKND